MFSGSVVLVQEEVPDYRLALFGELQARSSEFVVASSSSSNRVHPEFNLVGFPHQERGRGKPWHMSWLEGLTKWLDHQSPDVVVVPANPRFLSTYSVQRYCARNSVPLVGWGLGTMQVTTGVPKLFRRIAHVGQYRRYDAMIAYSSRAASEYARAGVDPSSIVVAQNAKWKRSEVPVANHWESPQNGFALVYLGRLIPTKAVDTLIRAVRVLADSHEGVTLTVIGDGPDRVRLEQLARKVGAPVTFLGHLTGPQLGSALMAADIAVLPGQGGLAMHDAMANSVPVLCGIGDGTQFDLLSGDCGWFLEDDKLATLVSAVEKIIASPSDLAAVRKAAHARITDVFNVERMADSFEDAFQIALMRRNK